VERYTGKTVRNHWTLPQRLSFYTDVIPNERGCILWIGPVDGNGYGAVAWEGRSQGAHRLAWIDANGPIPDGLDVLHKCDVPKCVNPDHLFLGTQADNVADMDAKGRRVTPHGVDHKRAKITPADVLAIRADSRDVRTIAAEYAIGSSQVQRIRHRQSWKHL